MKEKDLYKVLGIAKGANDDAIKKAYRKLARKHHPDVNPGNQQAEERFKEISFANDVLSDPEKKKVYDEFGYDALQAGFDPNRARAEREWAQSAGRGARAGAGGGFGKYSNFEDIFGDIFGERAGGGGFGRRAAARGQDLETEVKIDFLDAVRGATQAVSFRRHVTCSECKGEGGQNPSTCPDCGGSGQVRVGDGPIAFGRTCPRCRGRGQTFARTCPKCNGSGHVEETERLNVKIPTGVDDGSKIRLAGKGGAGSGGGSPGDLYLTVRVRSHPFLERKGRDLWLDLPVTVGEAALGASIKVPTIGGEVTLKVPPASQSGQRMRLRGKGISDAKGAPGDLYVRLLVQVPKNGDERVRAAVSELEKLYEESPRKNLRL